MTKLTNPLKSAICNRMERFSRMRRQNAPMFRMRISFLSKNFLCRKWQIYMGILPKLLRKEFRAVAGSANCFLFNKFFKKNYIKTQNGKKFRKGEKPIPVAFYEKVIVVNRYIQISSFRITFQCCSCAKSKQNTKDQDKLNSIGIF